MVRLILQDLNDELLTRLRRRAARHGRSPEEGAKAILRAALDDEQPAPEGDLATRIRRRFAGLGDVTLDLPGRPVPREPPFGAE
jgi:plasmid stability protein